MAQIVVYVLTALAAVVVVLTRLRLRGAGAAQRLDVGRFWPLLHTLIGTAALVVWTVFLVAPDDSVAGGPAVGIFGLGLFWFTTVIGLVVLMRWLPSKGRHASHAQADAWTSGPWLSVLGHLGMVVGVAYFTWAYWTATV
ncbi:hypothetical protein [Nocardioides acrostichi]|uniref:Uncharacterized protein n=1 Tax=Nocardioides acrostichi TaxID=2784339 RepID=A0A930V278_9ACTN|nr:hypothetical protein [Nocardioides acrostichi]MBF4162375.1 hypothetical protein [Nocardioides acrostichi]